MTSIANADEVLDYWFGAPGSAEYGTSRSLWFIKSVATDEYLRARFAATLDNALAAPADDVPGDAHACLARIIVLDQFTRNVFRGSPRAFAGDGPALQLARTMVRQRLDRNLIPVERMFVYLPFEHDESAGSQRESLHLFEELAQTGLPEAQIWARKHAEVIERFGRFPHRNEILGRTSTVEEIDFLKQPGSRF